MNIVILDTGCANLSSVKNAIKKIGYSALITSDPKTVLQSEKIFLPGVGTASSVMQSLSEKKLINIIKNTNIPILGICLGMQLFCTFSEEGTGVKTLGILESFVSILKSDNLPLPHMGWNTIFLNVKHPLFKNIKNKSRFYFVHSYFVPINKYTLAVSKYEIFFSSIIQKKNFFGVQFHPEKSGDIGLQFLKNFIEMKYYDYSSI